MRRVAVRAGAFMLWQCATKRVNKIPKEVWTDDRLRTSPLSTDRDGFVNANLDYFPFPNFDWSPYS